MMNRQFKILIGDDSAEGLAWANLIRQRGMYTMSRPRNGRVILDTLRHEQPDVLIIEAKMPEYDAVALMAIISAELPKAPVIIVVSSYDSPQVEREVMEAGADYYMVRPFAAEALAERVENLLGSMNISSAPVSASGSVENIVTGYIREIGIPAHLLGYAYLRAAVALAADDSKLLRNFTGKLYPAVAKRFDTTPSAVERGIRHAVNHAHNKSGKRSPSNKEVIATLADDVLMDTTAQKRTQVPA